MIEEAGAQRTLWLAVGVGGDLAALAYFKYFNFITDIARDLGLLDAPLAAVTLPIGISFFTFTQIAYLADIHQRKLVSTSEPVGYGLFVSFFPHLIAGPILHHREMMPQFADPRLGRTSEHLAAGIALFAIGLFKKTVIADGVAPIVNPLFELPHRGLGLSLITAWVAALAYAMQIYFDFSGYSDMAIGIARMLGIDLPINFNSPYKSASISEFWRRWHITLSRFLRDYLYIALGGNRRGNARRTVNLFLTMLLGGIWHGAGWTFALWGALQGAYLVLERGLRGALDRVGFGPTPRWIATPLTLALVTIAL